LKKAVTEAEALLVGGGDGTVSSAAALCFKAGVPLAVIPGGTMNLFARSLGIPLALNTAVDALAAGQVDEVDIATANGRPFVHQFSVGIHAKMVKLRNQLTYRSRIGKIAASVRAMFSAISKPANFRADVLTPRGLEQRITAGISVSNNPFGEGHLPHADALDEGVLGIYIAKPLSSWQALKLSVGVIRGRWKSAPEVVERASGEVSIRFPHRRSSSVAVIDGELITLPYKVDIKIHPRGLRVILPRMPGAASASDMLALTEGSLNPVIG
jgi:diacylglycerol kinase family enzyme